MSFLFSVKKMLLRDYLKKYHGISRRKITNLIDQGVIFVNKQQIENYKAEISENDELIIKTLPIIEKISFKEKWTYPEILLFNKPIGYTCSKSDPYNKTIYELLPSDFKKNYYYIGRLDKNSRGLMLLTTNSRLVHEYEHPSKEVEKTYIVKLNKCFQWNLKGKILKGISEGGELLRTKDLKKGEQGKIIITLNEGKKRHIRRIFKFLGYTVMDLQRISIGKYTLGTLKEGKYKAIV